MGVMGVMEESPEEFLTCTISTSSSFTNVLDFSVCATSGFLCDPVGCVLPCWFVWGIQL